MMGTSKTIALLRDGNERQKRSAARTLAKAGDMAAVEPLIEALESGDAALRESAAWALGQLRAVNAAGPLRKALDRDDEWVRLRAAEALTRLGDADGLEVLLGAIGSTDLDQPPVAVGALENLGSKGEPYLIRILRDGEQPRCAREPAATALRQFESADARHALQEATRDGDRFVSAAASRSLGG